MEDGRSFSMLAAAAAAFALGWMPAAALAHDDHDQEHDDGSSSFVDLAIAGDLDYAVPIDSIGDSGGGFAVRVGGQLHVPLLVLTPELGFSYHAMDGEGSPELSRMFAGARVGIGEIFRIGATGHVGIAWLDVDLLRPNPSRNGFAYDLGLFFDFTLLPLLDLGVHAAYNQLSASDDDPAYHWLTFGAHAALIL
jgi:hypothetical protein